ncbi:O-antigen ligase family protein [Pseudomonas brassicacearum]|uniref:O-antigen ligase family protein n=1 Tax=Pseudomonas brassicacearum TaxID=930166 RepID=UPI000720F771|nr:hypothetical protein [Pseudomonas brassicacearum]ALQ02326.1 hypothetical protein AK973_1877 [Pseudomonas brassicacearum]
MLRPKGEVPEVGREKLSSFFVAVISLWLVISTIYYIEFLFSGNILASRDDHLFHKMAKYLVTLGVSMALMLRSGCYLSSLIYGMALFLVCIIYSIFPDSLWLIEALIVFFSMSGMALLLGSCTEKQRHVLVGAILFGAFCAGVMSFYEMHFLVELYQGYWAQTGTIRSISTLFNPNNLGLYMGASLILLFGYKVSLVLRGILFLPIFYGFCMSGSRTAWMALFITFFVYCLLELRRANIKIIFGLAVAFLFLSFGVAYFIVVGEFYAPERMLNFDSALIRFERYFEFVQNFDLTYFLPDSEGARLGLVSESAYFTLMNSLGALGFMLFLVFVVFIFKARSGVDRDVSFKLVFWYYVVCALFENTLNSFPNNQMFFISMGVFFVFRESQRNKVRG